MAENEKKKLEEMYNKEKDICQDKKGDKKDMMPMILHAPLE